MIRISSRQNPQIKRLRALTESARERHRQRQTLLDGPHLIDAYLRSGGRPVLVVISAQALAKAEIQALLARLAGVDVITVDASLLRSLAPVESPVGIVAQIDIPESVPELPESEFVVLLDRVQDPGNVGAIARSAAAAGASGLVMSAQCADPWSPRTLRAGMGAQFAIPVRTNVDLVEYAARFQGSVVAAAISGGRVPADVDLTGQVALLVGGEGAGLDPRLHAAARITVTIPMARGVESLNAGAAAAIIMFERVRQRAAHATHAAP